MNTNAINIRDFILEENEINKETAPKPKKASSVPKFEVIFASNPDFIVQRTTAKTQRTLVVNISKRQYYLKSDKGGDEGNIVLLTQNTASELNKFIGSYEVNVGEAGINWIDCLPKGLNMCKLFLRSLESADICQAIKNDITFLREGNSFSPRVFRDSELFVILRKKFSELSTFQFYAALDGYCALSSTSSNLQLKLCSLTDTRRYHSNELKTLSIIKEKYGVSGLLQFIDAYKELPFPCRYISSESTYLQKLLDTYNIPYKKFETYFLHEQVRQGFADRSGFVATWLDTLEMQSLIYNKVLDKYPDNLSSYHDKLAFLSRLRKEEIDEKRWRKAAEKAEAFEWEDKDSFIVFPENKSMLLDEATQQSNCVASYASRITSGECLIFLLRQKKNPDSSWVTIEVRGDKIVQMKMRYNRALTEPAEEKVEKWAKDKDLVIVCS